MSFVLEIQKKTMEIKLYGKSYTLRFPTWDELEQYDEVLNSKTTVMEINNHMRAHLEMMGLPQEVSKQLDSVDIKTVIRFVQDPESAKKNSQAKP